MSNNNVPGSNQNVNVQVRALTIDPTVTSQYKTIILKKNIVNGVNTLTQDMINQSNIKYVIKYDYSLGGIEQKTINLTSTNSVVINGNTYYYTAIVLPIGKKISKPNYTEDFFFLDSNHTNFLTFRNPYIIPGSGRVIYDNVANEYFDNQSYYAQYIIAKDNPITVYIASRQTGTKTYLLENVINVPNNSILSFDNGSIIEGSIISNNTKIESGISKIFNYTTSLYGKWDITEGYAEWFGAKGDGVTYDTDAIQNALDSFDVIRLLGRDYCINKELSIVKTKTLKGENTRLTGSRYITNYTNIICSYTDDNSICIDCNTNGVIIENISFKNINNNRKGIAVRTSDRPYLASHITIDNVKVEGFNIGFELGSFFNYLTRIEAYNCYLGVNAGPNDNTPYFEGGVTTTQQFLSCYFHGCYNGVYVNSYGALFENCGFDENENIALETKDYTTIISCYFEYNNKILKMYSNNVIINPFILQDVNKFWNSYNDAVKFIDIRGNNNIFESLKIRFSGDTSVINPDSADCKIIDFTDNVEGGVYAIFKQSYRWYGVTNIHYPQQVVFECYDSTSSYSNVVAGNCTIFIKCKGKQIVWDGTKWLNYKGQSEYSIEDHGIIDARIKTSKTKYTEFCEFNPGIWDGICCFLITGTFSTAGGASGNKVPIMVSIDHDTVHLWVERPYSLSSYGGGDIRFIRYTKSNGNIGFAILGHNNPTTSNISVICNNRTNNDNPFVTFTLTQIDDINDTSKITNVEDIIPVFGYGGYGTSRPNFPKPVGFQFFDTSLSPARPIYWDGTQWVDATGAQV